MSLNWYAFRSKPNKEVFLYEQLLAQRIDAFLPLLRVQVVNPRSRKYRPYFPGYLFVRFDLSEMGFSTLQWIPGSLGLVNFGGQPAPVSDTLVIALQKKMEQIENAGGEVFDGLNVGDPVQIQAGPFAGYEAIFNAKIGGTERVRVLLKLLQGRLVELDLPSGQISRI